MNVDGWQASLEPRDRRHETEEGKTGMKRVHLRIHGQVQGVWFRGWTVDEASQRGLSGWVRNVHDGTVEAVVAGDDAKVDEMIQRCHEGPPAARVSKVEVEDAHDPVEPGFHQVPSV
jgi:acylphosphatase